MTGNTRIRTFTILLLIQALLLSGCGGKDDMRFLREQYDYVLGYRDFNPGPGKSPVNGEALLTARADSSAEPAADTGSEAEYEEPAGYEESGASEAAYSDDTAEEPEMVADAGETPEQAEVSEGGSSEASSEAELGSDPVSEADSGAPAQGSDPSQNTNTEQTGGSGNQTPTPAPAQDGSSQAPTPTPTPTPAADDDDDDVITEKKKYGLKETWTVAGAFSVTINSVISTPIRNEDDDINPAVVYLVDYTYRNEGYSDPDGLLIYVDDEIIDSAGQEGESYDLDVGDYEPREIMPGESCDAQVNIALYNDGPFDLIVGDYDNNDDYHEATFHITP